MDIDDKRDVNGEFLARRLTLVRGEAREVARIKRRSSSWSSTPSGNYLKQSWPTTRTAPSQVASRSYSSCRARHDTGIVRPQPPRVGDGRLPRPTSLLVMVIANTSPGGVHPGTVCGGSAAAWWGLRNLRTKSMGLGFLGVGRSSGEDVPPTLALSPSIPRPPNRVRGRGMKRPRARETGREKI